MRRVWKALLAVLLILGVALGIVAFAYRPPSDIEARRVLIADLAEAGVRKGAWPGIMWAEVVPGEVRYVGAAGFADIASGRAMTPDTTMPIASISKVIIGLAGAQAIHDGLLDPDAPVDGYLGFPVDTPRGTLPSFTQLATHTSGILDNYEVLDGREYHFGSTRHPMPVSEFLAAYLGRDGAYYDPVKNFAADAPGVARHYSNVTASLAAETIAGATGEDFASYSERVVAPLGFSVGWGQLRPPPPDAATLYTRGEGRRFEPLTPYGLVSWPDGQFNASGRELARLLATIMDRGRFEGRQLIDPEVIEILTAPHAAPDKPDETGNLFGLFWSHTELNLALYNLPAEGHNGGDPGVFTMMYMAKGADVGFVLMFTSNPFRMDHLRALRIVRLLAGMPAAEGG